MHAIKSIPGILLTVILVLLSHPPVRSPPRCSKKGILHGQEEGVSNRRLQVRGSTDNLASFVAAAVCYPSVTPGDFGQEKSPSEDGLKYFIFSRAGERT